MPDSLPLVLRAGRQPRGGRRPSGAAGSRRPSGRQLLILRVGQMLMGRAVAVVRQGRALAREALAGGGAALWWRAADGGVALVRVLDQELLSEAHVARHYTVDVRLIGHREVATDVAEQR